MWLEDFWFFLLLHATKEEHNKKLKKVLDYTYARGENCTKIFEKGFQITTLDIRECRKLKFQRILKWRREWKSFKCHRLIGRYTDTDVLEE
jgi:hypothetical protein